MEGMSNVPIEEECGFGFVSVTQGAGAAFRFSLVAIFYMAVERLIRSSI
jgi:hypothetical protein